MGRLWDCSNRGLLGVVTRGYTGRGLCTVTISQYIYIFMIGFSYQPHIFVLCLPIASEIYDDPRIPPQGPFKGGPSSQIVGFEGPNTIDSIVLGP